MHRMLQSPVVRVALLAMALGLLFLGQRGIWDPDEGRYTNVALHMLDSGDWIDPHRSQEIGHWTKPPLTYWAIAASVGTFGHTPWAARLPAALAYLLCVWLAFRITRRLAPGSETQAALAYATMLFPIGAAHLITTDYVLAACETLAMWAFVEARFGEHAQAPRWIAAMWAGFALAFLAKGPPGLLPLLAVVAFDMATPGRVRPRVLQ
jgi:4-amino-4-deoxy-L-arabinose transferase-like glycosyltransferase